MNEDAIWSLKASLVLLNTKLMLLIKYEIVITEFI